MRVTTYDNMAEQDDTNTPCVDDEEEQYCVFYCACCREILGDSLSTVRINKDLGSISLQVVTDAVAITNDCETAAVGPDKGSTYNILECHSCQTNIGQCYETTPKALDCIRDIYTLNLKKVKSYQLGGGENTNTYIDRQMDHSTQELEKMIVKTQSIVLSLHERVQKLEALIVEVDSSESDNVEQELTKSSQKKRKIK